jgi:hypothetical protein
MIRKARLAYNVGDERARRTPWTPTRISLQTNQLLASYQDSEYSITVDRCQGMYHEAIHERIE